MAASSADQKRGLLENSLYLSLWPIPDPGNSIFRASALVGSLLAVFFLPGAGPNTPKTNLGHLNAKAGEILINRSLQDFGTDL